MKIYEFKSRGRYRPYLYKFVLRFCSLDAMLPRRRRTARKAGGVSYFRFQNECNKEEIALRVMQFWSEVKLVITNRTPASRSCDFVITRLISDQIAPHSVQFPLFIGQKMQLTGLHNDNEMRNVICVDTQTSIRCPCYSLYCGCVLPIMLISVSHR